MTIYRLRWYLRLEEQQITRWFGDKNEATDQYDKLKEAVTNGFGSLIEFFTRSESSEFHEGEVLHTFEN